MARYSSLCVFLALFALHASIIEASGVGGSGPPREGSSYGIGGLAAKVSSLKDGLMGIWQYRWENVVYSEIEDEKGVLTNMAVGDAMDDLMYRFYPARSLGKKGVVTGAEPAVEFAINDITWVDRKDNVVFFKRGSEKVYTFKFSKDNDARAFVGQQTHLR